MIEKYKKFLLVFVALLFCASVIYTGGFIWANSLENGTSGYFVKNLLLENTKDRPRIIIESGSNSQHGINSLMIEKELGQLTLNMAHHAGYPLYLKFYHLLHNLNKDDVIILPLEYNYYTRKEHKIETSVLDELVANTKSYFNNLPLSKKITILTQINSNQTLKPYKDVFNHIKQQLFCSNCNFDAKKESNKLLHAGERGDVNYTALLNNGLDLSKRDDNKGFTCQEYIMFGDEINSDFANDLKLLKKISKETGAKFIFTYPALAGKNCFDFSTPQGKKLKSLIEQIKPLVESYGFLFIGNPFDSYFPNNMLNTYWHIDEKARDIRTKRLIEELKKTGLFNTNK
nr:hypothetical protein [uncultured Campylobacter sp.]